MFVTIYLVLILNVMYRRSNVEVSIVYLVIKSLYKFFIEKGFKIRAETCILIFICI